MFTIFNRLASKGHTETLLQSYDTLETVMKREEQPALSMVKKEVKKIWLYLAIKTCCIFFNV